MKTSPFFYPAVLLVLLILACLSGCIHEASDTSETITVTATGTPVTGTPEPVQTRDPAYEQERISPALRVEVLQSAASIPYLSMNVEEKNHCIWSDTLALVTATLADPNAQDMLMKGGHITGIGPYLPRSAKTTPGTATCTATVYISSRNITSAFVIDQKMGAVTQQGVEVPDETHVRTSGNRTIVSDADSIVFVFVTDPYYHAD
ncbi:MAG: hypothetical protein WC586_12815 [Methanoregula sp.]